MRVELLTEEQIRRVHNASIAVLERTGVVVPHPGMLARLEGAGARVDRAAQRVRLPEALVMQSLSRAEKKFTLYGRDPAKTARFGQGTRNYNSIAGEASWVEEPGGARRFATLPDAAAAARVADALKNIGIVGAMSDPHEIPIAYRCVEVLATLFRNTAKPVHVWFHDRPSAKYIVEMLIALRGSEKQAAEMPPCYSFLEPISPLHFPFHGIDLLFETARLNLPVSIGPMAQMGLSAPMSIAGTLVQENAEILAGNCIVQLVRPGTPICYGGICHAFDMRTTQMIFSGPEQALFGVAMTEIGKRYGLPVYINVGLTDAKRPDAQAGLEAGITLALGAAAGADIFGHMGISGVDQAASLDMLVFQDEVIDYVESALRDPDFSDEALGVELIDRVGPGGTFIDTEHTVERFRGELWFPRLLDRDYYQRWLDEGAKTTEERCLARKHEILAGHQVVPLLPELSKSLDEALQAAKRDLGGAAE
ncbi:MAG: trimethylamine methyltransferase family protein [Planctomycetota bacterium]